MRTEPETELDPASSTSSSESTGPYSRAYTRHAPLTEPIRLARGLLVRRVLSGSVKGQLVLPIRHIPTHTTRHLAEWLSGEPPRWTQSRAGECEP